jgi:hypothetical protein
MSACADAYGTVTRFAGSMCAGRKRMQNTATIIAALACLLISALAFYKLVPRDGRPSVGFMQSEGMAVTVTLVLMFTMTIGVMLLVKVAME